MTIRRGADSLWYAKLDAADAALMGTEWVPLPLTASASEEYAVKFAAGTPMGREGVTVVR